MSVARAAIRRPVIRVRTIVIHRLRSPPAHGREGAFLSSGPTWTLSVTARATPTSRTLQLP